MQALLDAVAAKFSGSDLFDTVGGRIYRDIADSLDCPYVVWSVVSSAPDKVFGAAYSDTLIQFSLFGSRSAGTAQMGTMYANLKALFDECTMTITGKTLIWIRETNLVTMAQELDTPLPDGSTGLYMWAVDYEATVKE